MTRITRPGERHTRPVKIVPFIPATEQVQVRRLKTGEIQVGGTYGLAKEEAVALLREGLRRLNA